MERMRSQGAETLQGTSDVSHTRMGRWSECGLKELKHCMEHLASVKLGWGNTANAVSRRWNTAGNIWRQSHRMGRWSECGLKELNHCMQHLASVILGWRDGANAVSRCCNTVGNTWRQWHYDGAMERMRSLGAETPQGTSGVSHTRMVMLDEFGGHGDEPTVAWNYGVSILLDRLRKTTPAIRIDKASA
jgi:hypothetical protein